MMVKCPKCDNELILKKEEAYKNFFLCTNIHCPVITVIVTSTEKVDMKW